MISFEVLGDSKIVLQLVFRIGSLQAEEDQQKLKFPIVSRISDSGECKLRSCVKLLFVCKDVNGKLGSLQELPTKNKTVWQAQKKEAPQGPMVIVVRSSMLTSTNKQPNQQLVLSSA